MTRCMFGTYLRDARVAAGMSQYTLAERVRLSRVAITRLEQGSRAPSYDALLRLAKALDLDLNELKAEPERAAP